MPVVYGSYFCCRVKCDGIPCQSNSEKYGAATIMHGPVAEDEEEAKEKALNDGWKPDGEKWLCPKCSGE